LVALIIMYNVGVVRAVGSPVSILTVCYGFSWRKFHWKSRFEMVTFCVCNITGNISLLYLVL